MRSSPQKQKQSDAIFQDEEFDFTNDSDNEETMDDKELKEWQYQNPAYAQTNEQLEDIENCSADYEIVDYVSYENETHEWVTMRGRRRIGIQPKLDYVFTPEAIEFYKKLYTREPAPVIYRSKDAKFPLQFVEGAFVLCGCALKSCKINVACVLHYCAFCVRPIHTFCLFIPGTYGCCRDCFIERHHSKSTTTTTIARTKQVLNARQPAKAAILPSDSGNDANKPSSSLDISVLATPQQQPTEVRGNKDNSIVDVNDAVVANAYDIDAEEAVAASFPNTTKNARIDKDKSNRKNTNISSGGIIEVSQKGGVLEPPIFRQEYIVDEIERLADQSEKTITANLWTLACNIVYDSFARDENIGSDTKGSATKNKSKTPKKSPDEGNDVGKDVKGTHRYLAYYTLMSECITNFPDRSDGAFILKYFAVDVGQNAEWPQDLLDYWESKIEDCRQNLKQWLTQKNCVLTADEKASFLAETQVRIYVGSIINETCSKTEKFANHCVNKHWPKTFKSGESACGLLQIKT